jgi:uncharacterized membrane protein YphA (DoxX/SURF4 family)
MSALLRNPYILFCSRAVLGLVFILAGMDKIVFPDAFAASIEGYKLAPYAAVNVIALVLPWMELICGLFLLGGVYLRGSSAIVSALLVFFIFAVISAMLRELKIDCGCFGKEHATPVSWSKVVENTGLTLLGLHILLFSGEPPARAAAQEAD